jgi:hypothetical protein
MPGGDRTGPMGMGPMTGRAAGYCAGYPVPGYMNPAGGRGFGGGGWGRGFGGGWGRGFGGGGRGWRHRYYATGVPGWAATGWGAAPAWGAAPGMVPTAPTRDVELEALKAQAEYLENSLGEIRKRVQELEAEEQKSGS